MNQFQIGDRVRITENARHIKFHNKQGTIRKIVKSRKVIAILCDDQTRYEAYFENVQLLNKEEN